MYRAAELEHILCTASWSQVAKCVPIHSLNITTAEREFLEKAGKSSFWDQVYEDSDLNFEGAKYF